jgi:hypothetical protein
MAFEDHSLRKKTFRWFFYFKKTFALDSLWGPLVKGKKPFIDFQIKKKIALYNHSLWKKHFVSFCMVFFY